MIQEQLMKEDYYGKVINKRFVIHKRPEHFLRMYAGFGCSQVRLAKMFQRGITECQIFYHPNDNTTELYKTTIEKWLQGREIINKRPNSKPDIQRVIEISECEKG